MIIRTGPKSQEEKEVIIKQIQNLIITGEIHEKTVSENANQLSISRITLREYLPIAYHGVDINPELLIKKVKDTRQFLIDVLLKDFNECTDSLQRSFLSKNISAMLDSQEKSSVLLIQFKEENKKEEVITSGFGFYTKYLSKLSHRPATIVEVECQSPSQ